MASEDIHLEVKKELENMPKDVLQNVLAYLKETKERLRTEAVISHNMNIILEEDDNLLKRLAK